MLKMLGTMFLEDLDETSIFILSVSLAMSILLFTCAGLMYI